MHIFDQLLILVKHSSKLSIHTDAYSRHRNDESAFPLIKGNLYTYSITTLIYSYYGLI